MHTAVHVTLPHHLIALCIIVFELLPIIALANEIFHSSQSKGCIVWAGHNVNVNVVCLNCRSAMSVESVQVFIGLCGLQTTHTRLMAATLDNKRTNQVHFLYHQNLFSCTVFAYHIVIDSMSFITNMVLFFYWL